MKAFGVLHIASFTGNIGDNANHLGFRSWFETLVENKIQWNDKMPAYALNRTKVMTEFFENIKNLRIEFPHTVSMDSFKEDIMNIQIDYDEERGFMKYINIGPDDFAHACIFGTIACELMFGAVK